MLNPKSCKSMVQMIFLFDWVISRLKMLIFRGVEIETMDLGVRI